MPLPDIFGAGTLGSGAINPNYAEEVLELAGPLLDLDFVRRSLLLSVSQYSNEILMGFVDAVNENADTELSEFDLPAAASLSSSQRANAKLYFAYEVGEKIFSLDADKVKLLENMKRLKLIAANKLVAPSGSTKGYDFVNDYYPTGRRS